MYSGDNIEKWMEVKPRHRWIIQLVITIGSSASIRIVCLENRKGGYLSTGSQWGWSSANPQSVYSSNFQVYACMSTEYLGRRPQAWFQKDPGEEMLRQGTVHYRCSELFIEAVAEVSREAGTDSFSCKCSFHGINLIMQCPCLQIFMASQRYASSHSTHKFSGKLYMALQTWVRFLLKWSCAYYSM